MTQNQFFLQNTIFFFKFPIEFCLFLAWFCVCRVDARVFTHKCSSNANAISINTKTTIIIDFHKISGEKSSELLTDSMRDSCGFSICSDLFTLFLSLAGFFFLFILYQWKGNWNYVVQQKNLYVFFFK